MCSGIEGDGDEEGNLIYWRGSSHGTISYPPCLSEVAT
jgi:hypothetical protein